MVVGGIDEAIEVAGTSEGGDEVFVIGGGQLYQELIGRADKLKDRLFVPYSAPIDFGRRSAARVWFHHLVRVLD